MGTGNRELHAQGHRATECPDGVVSPLRCHDRPVRAKFAEPKSVQFVSQGRGIRAEQSIDVGMREHSASRQCVLVHEGKGGARHPLSHAERASQGADEKRLARTEIPRKDY